MASLFHKTQYTKEQDERIIAHAGTAKELAEAFGVSVKAIHSRRSTLKFKALPKQMEWRPLLSKKEIVKPTFARPSWFNENIVALAMRRN